MNDDRMKEKKKMDLLNFVLVGLLLVVLFFGVQRMGLINGFSFTGVNGETLSQLGLEYYLENYGDQIEGKNPEAIVQNYGCHREIHIYDGDQLLMRLSYYNGKVYEI
jgi:hypothetical protein